MDIHLERYFNVVSTHTLKFWQFIKIPQIDNSLEIINYRLEIRTTKYCHKGVLMTICIHLNILHISS
uniref:Uncharacterized protein n=1 Tax=Anguilla anguilla TaxID=7936 RepID=A0A0E9UBH6_ANGAN